MLSFVLLYSLKVSLKASVKDQRVGFKLARTKPARDTRFADSCKRSDYGDIRIPPNENRCCGARNCGDGDRMSGSAWKRGVRRHGGYVHFEPSAAVAAPSGACRRAPGSGVCQGRGLGFFGLPGRSAGQSISENFNFRLNRTREKLIITACFFAISCENRSKIDVFASCNLAVAAAANWG